MHAMAARRRAGPAGLIGGGGPVTDKGHRGPRAALPPPVPDPQRSGRQVAGKIRRQAPVSLAVPLRRLFADQDSQDIAAASPDLQARALRRSQPPRPPALQPRAQHLGRGIQVPDGVKAARQQRHQTEARHRSFCRHNRWPARQQPQDAPLLCRVDTAQPDRPPVDQAQTVPVQHLGHRDVALAVRHPRTPYPGTLRPRRLPVVPALLQRNRPAQIKPVSPAASAKIIPENPHDPVKTCET